MQKYAVIEINNNQFRVEEGQEILVDKMDSVPEVKVLLLVDGKKLKIGTPYVKGVKVGLKMGEQVKGKKILVSKFRAKSRYRKRIGFRPSLTKIQVGKIS